MKSQTALTGALALLSTLFVATSAWAEPCPGADGLLAQGQAPEAEIAARVCLDAHPDDGGVWAVLARALAEQGRHAEALLGVQEALTRHPEDLDLELVRLRLLAWSDRWEEAWKGVIGLPPQALQDPETLLFTADLASWRNDDPEALRRYGLLLERNPTDAFVLARRARVLEGEGRLIEARSDLQGACAVEPAACGELDDFDARHWRFRAFGQAGWSFVMDRPDGQNGLLDLQARVAPNLLLGAQAYHRRRDFGLGAMNDTLLQATLAWTQPSGLLLEAAAGGTPAPDFLPLLSAWVEPGWSFDAGIELRLKLWRLQYESGGSSLLSPAVTFITPPVSFTLRYYASLDDEGRRGDAAVLRIRTELPAGWSAWAGTGGGDRADYLTVLNEDSDRFLLFFAGAGWDFTSRDRVQLDLSWRDEAAGQQLWRELELMAGYGRSF